ncbi:globin domain-containing protein [Actinomadura opuntiae]|uniref:globin domain-containing protein n=1 Tax=Actinomadura sp. OS1-43 TaxID=604315 RepID=UPI00255AFDC2|nr:globin domain-containing protein [Actinomadura sp. OS1-43]MDL4813047.1 globin domain-containing protein [Actinomadura sp. OS1-43]
MLKESFTLLETRSDKAVSYFYGRLFAANPRLRALFPVALEGQRARFFHALTRIVWSQDNPEELAAYLAGLGRDHRKYGVAAEHYRAVEDALIATLRVYASEVWSPRAEEAWTEAYRSASATMIEAAERDAGAAPPWWTAEVVEHDRRADDLAVLTLSPERPLPFAPGQYVTVQTFRWPRVWRPYSIANAPRSDGRLRLHVRARPGGWVSGALVRGTAPGDTVLLGPATGSMTLDPDSGRDLLLVAGGTGLAPIKALAEQAVTSGRERRVRLVVGARTEADLYDLSDLRLLETAYPWVRVLPVLSGEPESDRPCGTPADVLGDLDGAWDDLDAYIAGPVPMVRTTVAALQRLGTPLERIHHDLLKAEE